MTLQEIGRRLKAEFPTFGIKYSQSVLTVPEGPTFDKITVDVTGLPIMFDSPSLDHAIQALHLILNTGDATVDL